MVRTLGMRCRGWDGATGCAAGCGTRSATLLDARARWRDGRRGVTTSAACEEDAGRQAYRHAVQQSWRRLVLWSRVKQEEVQTVEDALMDHVTKVCVFGGGSFGTAISAILARKFPLARVSLVVRNASQCAHINAEHRNPRYLSEHALPESIVATTSAREGVEGAQFIIHAIPVQASAAFLDAAKAHIPSDVPVVTVSKGLEVGTGLTMHEVVQRALGKSHPLVALSGPSFAKEVMEGLPTNLVAASEDEDLARRVQALFASPSLRVNTTRDVTGVEIGGALKNVVAIAAGIVEGLGLGNNALSALVAQGTAEIKWLAGRMGADASTITSVAGVGDIMLTSFVDLSRNRTVGKRLGRGESLEEILESSTQVKKRSACARERVAGKKSGSHPVGFQRNYDLRPASGHRNRIWMNRNADPIHNRPTDRPTYRLAHSLSLPLPLPRLSSTLFVSCCLDLLLVAASGGRGSAHGGGCDSAGG